MKRLRLARSGAIGIGAPFLLLGVVLTLLSPAGDLRAAIEKVEVTFSADDLRIRKFHGYDVIYLSGTNWLNAPGIPCLPVKPLRLDLPPGAVLKKFRTTVWESTIVEGDYSILPYQLPRAISRVCPDSLDTFSYDSFGIYPRAPAEIVRSTAQRRRTRCDILVYPVRYIAAQGRVVLYGRIVLDVCYDLTSSEAGESGDKMKWCNLVHLLSENGYHLESHKMHDAPKLPIGGHVDYLIVTSEELRAAFEPLRRWKMRKGLSSTVIAVETIAYTYDGKDLAEKIRNCIRDFHDVLSTQWVLLGGDVDIVPTRIADVPVSDRPYLPCDLYYSDLDGTWNDDGDLRWGEVPDDSIDMYSDVYVGRAPVSTPAEAEIFVNKVLTYEGCHGGTEIAQDSLLFAGEVLWGDPALPNDPEYTDGGRCKDVLDSLCLPEDIEPIKLYETRGNLNRSSMISHLNSGMDIINLVCHGQYTSISVGSDLLTNVDLESLTNTPCFGVLYSTACYSGGFDQPECIGEAWVLSPAGGGFFIGNSRYGYNLPGFPGEGPSDLLDQAFFKAVFIDNTDELGKAHSQAKDEYVSQAIGDPYLRYVIYELNLLGDPESDIWKAKPKILSVWHPSCLALSSNVFEVEVSDGSGGVEGATVCLWKAGEIYEVDSTDATGQTIFVVQPAYPGTLLVTVTAPSFLPYLGQAVICETHSSPRDVEACEVKGPAVMVSWGYEGEPGSIFRIYRKPPGRWFPIGEVSLPETSFCDFDVAEGGTYRYWVSAVDPAGCESERIEAPPVKVMGSEAASQPLQPGLTVEPNPFVGNLKIICTGMAEAKLRVSVYDVTGSRVDEILCESDGKQHLVGLWDGKGSDGRDMAPGIYFVRTISRRRIFVSKVVLMR